MGKQKKNGKVEKPSESQINLTAAILNLITALLILIDKLTG